ncbi:MAG: transcriptional regulator [Planctomycetes bacterium]|nr:transcriptional regulator [Planctomycetota bacterium]
MTVPLEHVFSLEPVLHERSRLAIMSVLVTAKEASFNELKALLDLTDGNLSVHLRALESAGYVTLTKEFAGRRPRTVAEAAPRGRQAFAHYIDHLEGIVQGARTAAGRGRGRSTG